MNLHLLLLKSYKSLYDNNNRMVIRNIPDYFNSLVLDNSWSFSDKTPKETQYATHGYHRYPAKFIPQIVNPLIKQYTQKGDLVFDPFAGCGTTLLESKILGRDSVGTDINPVACLITKAKITPIDPKILESYFLSIQSSYKKFNLDKKYEKYLSNEKISYWFYESEIKKLGYLLHQILKIKSGKELNFFLCAFSNILKNCSKWLQTSNKPTRDLKKKPIDPFILFDKQVKRMMDGNNKYIPLVDNQDSKYVKCKIYQRDARKTPLRKGDVKLVVTSPPYVTSYEYADFHQLTGFWLDYIKNIREFRKKFIGTTYKSIRKINLNSKLASEIVNKLSVVDKKQSEEVATYFTEMNQVFAEMKRILADDGKVAIVIGNTTLKGVDILNAEVFVEQLQNLGFVVSKIIKRPLASKSLPTIRDKVTGRFTKHNNLNKVHAYAVEYILIFNKRRVN